MGTPTEPAAGIVITFKDVYGELRTYSRDVAQGLADVNVTLGRVTGHIEAIDNRNLLADRAHQDYEIRLRALERWRYMLPASVVVAIASALASIGEYLIRH